jgi:hypothetical protein
VSSSPRVFRLVAGVALAMSPMAVAIGQSSVTISPFMSYVSGAAYNPFAGVALTSGGAPGLALRGSAATSIEDPDTARINNGRIRPWNIDADAILFLGGARSLAPYLFAGIGLTSVDSSGVEVVNDGWSYGVGASLPLGTSASAFGEGRWRMSRYVLPTAPLAPSPTGEVRFGLSFHIGAGQRY